MSASGSIASIAFNLPAKPATVGERGSSGGGPPGPEPPGFNIKSAEEVATKEPIAPAQKLDLGPKEKEVADVKGTLAVDPKDPVSPVVDPNPVDPTMAGMLAIQAIFASAGTSAFEAPVVTPVKSADPLIGGQIVKADATSQSTADKGANSPTNVADLPWMSQQPGVNVTTAAVPSPVPSNKIQKADRAVKSATDDFTVGGRKAQGATKASIDPASATTKQGLPVDSDVAISSVTVGPTATPTPIPVTQTVQEAVAVAVTPVAVAKAVVATQEVDTSAVSEASPVAVAVPAAKKTATSTNNDKPTAKSSGSTAKAEPSVVAEKAAKNDSEPGSTFGRQAEAETLTVSSEPDADNMTEVIAANSTSSTPVAVAETDKTVAVVSKAGTKEVIRQLTDRIELMAAVKPKEGVTVHLEPANLGTISLVVKAIGKTIDAQIFASNNSVKDALEQSRTQLAESVQHRGLQLGSVSFASQSGQSGNQQHSTARQTMESTQQQNARSGQQASQQQSSKSDSRSSNAFSSTASTSKEGNLPSTLRNLARKTGVDLAI